MKKFLISKILIITITSRLARRDEISGSSLLQIEIFILLAEKSESLCFDAFFETTIFKIKNLFLRINELQI